MLGTRGQRRRTISRRRRRARLRCTAPPTPRLLAMKPTRVGSDRDARAPASRQKRPRKGEPDALASGVLSRRPQAVRHGASRSRLTTSSRHHSEARHGAGAAARRDRGGRREALQEAPSSAIRPRKRSSACGPACGGPRRPCGRPWSSCGRENHGSSCDAGYVGGTCASFWVNAPCLQRLHLRGTRQIRGSQDRSQAFRIGRKFFDFSPITTGIAAFVLFAVRPG